MSVFLSPDWFEAAADHLAQLQPVAGISASVQYVVSGCPDGKLTFHAEISDGMVASLQQGKAADPDIILSCSYDTALAAISGEQSPEAIFMSGALKVEGNHAFWLMDLRETRAAALRVLAEMTDA